MDMTQKLLETLGNYDTPLLRLADFRKSLPAEAQWTADAALAEYLKWVCQKLTERHGEIYAPRPQFPDLGRTVTAAEGLATPLNGALVFYAAALAETSSFGMSVWHQVTDAVEDFVKGDL